MTRAGSFAGIATRAGRSLAGPADTPASEPEVPSQSRERSRSFVTRWVNDETRMTNDEGGIFCGDRNASWAQSGRTRRHPRLGTGGSLPVAGTKPELRHEVGERRNQNDE